ncbi:MAG: SRPBCC family protein [Hyphomonadaceae bacterium]
MSSKIEHASFTLTRAFKATPERVYQAHTQEAAKRRWFVEGEGFDTYEYSIDARIGGREIWRGAHRGGPEITNNTYYLDLVENRRIIVAYEMTIGGKRISASLATIEIEATDSGSTLTFTEQGAYLDGLDKVENREHGTRELLEALAKDLEA